MKSPGKSNRKSPRAGTPRRRRVRNSEAESARLLDIVKRSLDDDLAEDVVVIDLAGKTAIADFMVVGSGRNPRHIGAMADHLRERIKDAGRPPPPVEGQAQAEWVLIDGGDVIIHLFRPESRALYNLEKIWGGPWTEPDSATEDEDARTPPAGRGGS